MPPHALRVLMRLVADEAAELAVLALEMAAERARAKRMASVALLMQGRSARRQLRRSRRHRAVVRAVGRSQRGVETGDGRTPLGVPCPPPVSQWTFGQAALALWHHIVG